MPLFQTHRALMYFSRFGKLRNNCSDHLVINVMVQFPFRHDTLKSWFGGNFSRTDFRFISQILESFFGDPWQWWCSPSISCTKIMTTKPITIKDTLNDKRNLIITSNSMSEPWKFQQTILNTFNNICLLIKSAP